MQGVSGSCPFCEVSLSLWSCELRMCLISWLSPKLALMRYKCLVWDLSRRGGADGIAVSPCWPGVPQHKCILPFASLPSCLWQGWLLSSANRQWFLFRCLIILVNQIEQAQKVCSKQTMYLRIGLHAGCTLKGSEVARLSSQKMQTDCLQEKVEQSKACCKGKTTGKNLKWCNHHCVSVFHFNSDGERRDNVKLLEVTAGPFSIHHCVFGLVIQYSDMMSWSTVNHK